MKKKKEKIHKEGFPYPVYIDRDIYAFSKYIYTSCQHAVDFQTDSET